MRKINQCTIDFAAQCIPHFRGAGVMWPELSSPERLVRRIERQLGGQKLDNLLDVEDILNQLLYDVLCLGRYAKLGNAVKFILTNTGNAKYHSSPDFIDFPDTSNNDDLQGTENNPNDLDGFQSSDHFPGDESHIAAIDIHSKFGDNAKDLFDLKVAGTTEVEIAQFLGISRESVKRLWSKLKAFIADNGYNIRSSFIQNQTTSWNKSRKQQSRTWDLPDSNHRSIFYKD